jgi:hypothetical protein
MSGTRGGSQQFGIRLSIDGADAVEAGLRRVQATAATSASAIEQTGQTTGRALAVIERGADVAAAGLRRMGGDFAALAPLVDGAGGAVGRLVSSLGAGAGLLGVLGAVGGAVGTAVALYQNWDTVTRAVGGAVDSLTGRVRANAAAITDANAALTAYLRLSETAAQAGNRRFIEQQREAAGGAQGRIAGLEADAARLDAAIARAQAGGATGAVIGRGGASGLVPTDEFGRSADQAVRDRLTSRQTAEIARLQNERAEVERGLAASRAVQQRAEAAIAGAVADQSNATPGRPPAEASPAAAPRGGGGGGRPAPSSDPLAARRDQFLATNDPFARYAQTLERIGQLQADLAAAGQSPLPDEAVVRATEQAMQEYERAVQGAGNSTRDLANGTKELERAGSAAAKALSGAFEDLVFEGASFDDVLKNLERSLLRIGNRAFLEPLVQQLTQLATGSGGSGAGGKGGLGGVGGIAGAIGSLFGGGGAESQAVGELLKSATAVASVAHTGGIIGAGGLPTRAVPIGLFANAPRFHTGGFIGPNEVPAILERGERVLNKQEAAAYNRGGGMTVNIYTPDAGSFRNSEGQLMSKMAAALSRSNRNR